MGLFNFFKRKKVNNKNKCKTNKDRPCISFVLLSQTIWSKQKLIDDIRTDWNLIIDDVADKDDTICGNINNIRIFISFIDSRIPNNEAEYNAKANYLWKNAEQTVSTHKSYIIIGIMGEENVKEKEELLVKISSSCLKQHNAVALYSDGVIYEPKFYIETSEIINTESFPIFNSIWFGIYGDKNIKGFYTYGLYRFGYKEIEIYSDNNSDMNELRNLIIEITGYVINNNIELHSGETIGLSEEQKLKITESKGIALDGITLKINIK